MRNSLITFLFILCAAGADVNAQNKFDPEPGELTANFIKWWTYYNERTPLSADFHARDAANKKISKNDFLDSLQTGAYIPIKAKDEAAQTPDHTDAPQYKLYRLPAETGDAALRSIRATIQNVAYVEARNHGMEGKHLPHYDFTDLNGNRFNNRNTKGKTVVLKTWFINCVPCVEEMPALNKLVRHYKQRRDILFLSVAMDPAANLRRFLRQKKFLYAIVPDKKPWLTDTLQAYNYPTHIVVAKDGRIRKVVNKEKELEAALARELRN